MISSNIIINKTKGVPIMKTNLLKYLSFLTIVFLFSAGLIFAQDSTKHKHSHMNNMEMKKGNHDQMDMNMDSTKSKHKNMNMNMNMKDHKNMNMDSSKTNKESLVREGEIDPKAIDKNKDGKVYQDVMDWNVISDEPGKCPLCGMKLKEVSLEKAKENLIKHDFKVKEK